MQQHKGRQQHPLHGCYEQYGLVPLFIFFTIEEHPVNPLIDTGLEQEIAYDRCQIDEKQAMPRQEGHPIARGNRPHIIYHGQHQRGEQYEPSLSAQFGGCVGHRRRTFVLREKEVLAHFHDKPQGAGKSQNGHQASHHDDRRHQVVSPRTVGHRVSSRCHMCPALPFADEGVDIYAGVAQTVCAEGACRSVVALAGQS